MRNYHLIYWRGSGDLPNNWYKDTWQLASRQVEYRFNSPDDYSASQTAMHIGMRANSDGVELFRVDANGIEVACYKTRREQPDKANSADFGMVQ